MDLGRANIGKLLPFVILGGVAGLAAALFLRGSAAAIFNILAAVVLLGLAGYVIYILAVKNKAMPTASAEEKQHALQFNPVAGKGVLYLYRAQTVGLLAGLDVNLDGRNIGQTRGYSFFRIELEPGQHSLSGASNSQPLTFDIAAGQVLYIEQQILMGAVKGSYEYRLESDIDKAQAGTRKGKMFLPLPA